MANVEVLNIKTKCVDMDYLKFGNGDKPFVIIPGLSLKSVILSANAIANAYSCFCNDYTVYLIDRKNGITQGYTIFDMAEDTAEVMKALGIQNAYVLGTSQGGMIAQLIAINHPELIKKLVLGSSSARIFDYSKDVMKHWKQLAEDNKITELCSDFVKRLYSEQFSEKYGKIIVKMNSDADEHDIKRFIALIDACENFDIRSKLQEIKCRVLVLGAQRDLVLTGEASAEMAEILGCEHYLYPPQFGHAVYDEANDYRDRILSFFNE